MTNNFPRPMDVAAAPLASPFLKWTGSKDQLLDKVLARIPNTIDVYREPFIGGGSVFFALASEARRRYRKAIISDVNLRLITTYQTVQDSDGVDRLIHGLRSIETEYLPLLKHVVIITTKKGKQAKRYPSAEAYYKTVVKQFNSVSLNHTSIDIAISFIFLNKTGFRGMFRENNDGEYNIPFGNYGKPTICNEPLLRACSTALQGVEVQHVDFETAIRSLWCGDHVYADPPYVPASATASFTNYSADGFNAGDQSRLAQCLREASRRGVSVLASNSYTAPVLALYEGAKIDIVDVKYGANPHESGKGSRKTTQEVLISM